MTSDALYGAVVTVMCVAAATVLGVTGHAIPGELWVLAGAGAGHSAGVSIPRGRPPAP